MLAGLAQPGTNLWTFTANDRIYSSPALGVDGSIYFGTTGGRVFALNAKGAKRWEFRAGGGVVSAPALGADETLYFGCLDSKVYALSSAGLKKWEFATSNTVYSSPAIGVDGTIYIGSSDTKLYALTPAGQEKWEYPTTGEVVGAPSVDVDGTVYFGSRDRVLYAVNADGTRKWEFLTGGWVQTTAAVGKDGAIYFGSADGKLYALNRNGTKRWEFLTGNGVYSSPVVGLDGTIYLAGYDGKLYALNPDGTERWETRMDSRVDNSTLALAADGTLYVGADDGKLYAFGSDGAKRWGLATGAPITFSSPAIAPDGTIYIGSDDGKLYAVRGASALAGGAWPMFGRDTRHTASGFVRRLLPPGYSPSQGVVVTLVATPLVGVGLYTVEDTPPPNWQVSEISDNGYFDSGNRRVRFGPFLDATARRLTYKATPPAGESGSKQFLGVSTADSSDRLLGGDQMVDLIPPCPADNQPVDFWLTTSELSAYAAAWKRGLAWPVAPSVIPSAYLSRAVALWSNGESYRYDTNFTTPPQWWQTATATLPAPALPARLSAGTVATNGTALAEMPSAFRPGVGLTVALAVTPSPTVVVYALEDRPPDGWGVGQILGGGFYDQALRKVKWGPFFDNQPRRLTYQVIPSASPGAFYGMVAFDGSSGEIGGQRQPALAGEASDSVVTRDLPPAYSRGAQLVVTLRAVPQTNAIFYLVEDLPPANWQVSAVSDSGTYDPASRKVKFGPFYDHQPRTLTYALTPPLAESGTRLFSGSFSVDGTFGVVGGESAIDPIPLHPADFQAIDQWMTIGEITAYGAAWKRGSNWLFGPNPIPASYLTQAIALWRQGEAYRYDSTVTSDPSWWTPLPTEGPPATPPPPALPTGSLATNGQAIADLPATVLPGANFAVTVFIAPATNVSVCALEDQPPPGWTVLSVSDGGLFDRARGKVKWGPFFDPASRSVSYQVAAPTNASIATAEFRGVAAFDGMRGEVTGERQIQVLGPSSPTAFARRVLPPAYSAGARLLVTLQTGALSNITYYVVEDLPPAGWRVGQVSDSGAFDATNRRVKFGPFFDGRSRALTYEITPPLGESGTKQFAGFSLVDGIQALVGGDHSLDFVPLHPADAQPIDSWMTIGEMTAYGAAWKRGNNGPFPPNPIPSVYLTHAVTLWMRGEYYGFDPNITNAPFGWVNRPTLPSSVLPPVSILPGATTTNGSASVDLPKFYTAGAPLTVVIRLAPASYVSVYAAEDQPPPGWLVSQIDSDGFFDPVRQKVKWGPFFDAQPRRLSYQASPPVGASGLARFTGGAAFDGATADLAGRRQTFSTAGGFAPAFGSVRLLSATGCEVVLQTVAGESYALEASTNLVDWGALVTLTSTNNSVTLLDPAATNAALRFYRAIWK